MLVAQISSWIVGAGMIAILIYVMYILFIRVKNVFNPPVRGPNENIANQPLPLGTLGQPNNVDKREEELLQHIAAEPNSEEVARWPQ